MTINPVSMTSQSITTNTDAILEVVYVEPDMDLLLDPPGMPGRIIAFFNGSTRVVTLYVIDNSGLQLLRVA